MPQQNVRAAQTVSTTTDRPVPETARSCSAHALSGGITSYIYAHKDEGERRAAVLDMSYLLRRALSVNARDIAPIPMLLESNDTAARDYIATQLGLWGNSPGLTNLFTAINLSEKDADTLRKLLISLVPLNEAARWLCEEFGHLRSARDASHCRRYLATWLTAQILGESGQAPLTGALAADVLQARIDTWASPMSGIEQSVHFERVIQPVLRRLQEIGKSNNTLTVADAANDRN